MRGAWFIVVMAVAVVSCGGSSSDAARLDASLEASRLDAWASDAAPDAPASAACSAYCEGIARTCAADPQYDSSATCLAYCRAMPEGSGATANTLGCRAEALAQFNGARPTTSCLAAGPGGNLGADHTCGSLCETFCGMALRICPGVFASAGGCMEACARFADRPVYAVPNTDRNTQGCRLYYLTQAAVRADLHCANIGANSPACR